MVSVTGILSLFQTLRLCVIFCLRIFCPGPETSDLVVSCGIQVHLIMPYQIVRNREGWILNEKGEILLRDTENATDVWIENNLICFDQCHRPCIKYRQSECDENEITEHLTFLYIENNYVAENVENSSLDELSETFSNEAGSSNRELADEENSVNITEDINNSITRNLWSYDSTLALISAVECRYEDLFHIHKKKSFWTIVHEELLSHGFNYLPKACQKKWENLQRTYKSCKDLKSKTGRGPIKFKFYDRMDEILGETPTNSSPHSIDVHKIQEDLSSEQETCDLSTDDTSSTPTSSKKRRNPTIEYIKLKKKYYEEKQSQVLEKNGLKRKYLEDIVNLKKERNELTKKRLELEERKIVALEKLSFTTG